MKVLFNCNLPFCLAHGGQAIQVHQTMTALRRIGVEAEPLRWWDESQTGDVLQFFGRMPTDQIRLAQQKNMKVVMAELLTGAGSRSRAQLRVQKIITRAVKHFAPHSFIAAFNWESYQRADALMPLTVWEGEIMRYLFDAPAERVYVVPNGVEPEFFNTTRATRGQWLVCTAVITERKRVLELAQAAVAAKTPLWVIGKAYGQNDPYAQQFFALAQQHPQILRYEGSVSDRAELARIYRTARGFVLLSTKETLSLSALEAAACECPLLLSDLPSARSSFGQTATYCPVTDSVERTAKVLRQFYDAAPQLPLPPKPLSWDEVAAQLKALYERLLNNSSRK
jgi:glycosyltransferase involved in cell wall biosynthesis